MRILALESSSKYFSLAIARDDTLLAKFHSPLGIRLSRLIMQTIERALRKSGLSLGKIDYFAVGLGPGSFTGLRVGLSIIKGFVFSLNKPVVGLVSLDTLAHSVNKFEGVVCPVIDAKRELVYCALYSVNGRLRRSSGYLLTCVEGLLRKIDKKQKVFFLGDGIHLYKSEIAKRLDEGAVFADKSLWYPKPENLITLAREKIMKREFSNPDNIVPLYLYPKECQIADR
jgi:tRNA threonylcarbamoyladenosine biosynthesis protein TsaB